MFSSSTSTVEDTITFTPWYIRGSGGVAIFWRKSLDHVIKKLPEFRFVAIALQSSGRPLSFVSSYLPCRSDCTDLFEETLDPLLVSSLMILMYSFLVISTCDLGPSGRPLATTALNTQGTIWQRYLVDVDRIVYRSICIHALA